MNTKELLKRAAIAPIALASAGGGYYLASTEIEDANSKVSQVEEQLEKSLQIIEQLQAQNDVYTYKLQKAENELIILKLKQNKK